MFTLIGQLFKVQCSGTTKVMLNINMTLRVERRFNQAASIYKGFVDVSVNECNFRVQLVCNVLM